MPYFMVCYGMVWCRLCTAPVSSPSPCHNTIPHASQCNHTMMRHAIPCHTMQYYSSRFLIHTWSMPHHIIEAETHHTGEGDKTIYVTTLNSQCPNNPREGGREGPSDNNHMSDSPALAGVEHTLSGFNKKLPDRSLNIITAIS